MSEAAGILGRVLVPLVVLAAPAAGIVLFNAQVASAMTCGPTATSPLCVNLTPQTAANPLFTSHTVSASITIHGFATSNPITFRVVSGPDAGQTLVGPATNKPVSFTIVNNGNPGTDVIQACVVDRALTSPLCDTATKTYVCPTGQQLVGLPVGPQCVTPFPGIAVAIGGGPGTTGPRDFTNDTPGPDQPAATDQDSPPFPSQNRADDQLDDLLG